MNPGNVTFLRVRIVLISHSVCCNPGVEHRLGWEGAKMTNEVNNECLDGWKFEGKVRVNRWGVYGLGADG